MSVQGCPKCMKHMGGKFCSICGTLITEFDKQVPVTDLHEVLSIAKDDKLITDQFDDKYIIFGNWVVPN